MDRRRFIATSSALLAGSTLIPRVFAEEAPVAATLTVGSTPGNTMPLDFTGLSYETPQLVNPDFFSPANTALVAEFKKLVPSGVLRFGGSLSDFTFWQGPGAPPLTDKQEAAITHAKTYFEWVLVDPIARKDLRSVLTPAAIHTLRAFLDATGWTCLYGLNFGSGNPELAALEAESVQQILGPKLIAFQLGNECDFFADSRRPKPWDFEHYWADYTRFTTAIRARVPAARFGGPDVAIRTDWVVDYSKAAKGQTVLLSKHHYAMGPAKDPAMNAEHLLGPDPDLDKQSTILMAASRASGIPCRMTETNSCFQGGKPGVSDAYASALWCADIMLRIAQEGWSGINLHGGGTGFYAPIVGDVATGITARPIAYGMRFAQMLSGLTFVDTRLTTAANVTAYAARKGKSWHLALVNKSPTPVNVSLANTPFAKLKPAEQWLLTAPALDSKTGIALTQSIPKYHQPITLAPYTARLLRFS